MLRLTFSLGCLLFMFINSFSQSKDDEIARLKRELEACKALASQFEIEAKRQEDIARQNEQRARRERYLAQAKAMALKSQELWSNKELESLLAQQAFFFNKKYSGYECDNDIYNALFYALKNNLHPLTESLRGHEKGAARSLVTNVVRGKIYSGGSDGRIVEWVPSRDGLWESRELTNATKHPGFLIYSMAVSANGKYLVAAGLYTTDAGNNFVELYDLQDSLFVPRRIYGFSQGVYDICFTPDSKGFYARDNSGKSIRYSDLLTAKEVIRTPAKINGIDLSPDGSQIAGAGDNGTLYVWDLNTNNAAAELDKGGSSLFAVEFSPDNRQIVIGDETGILKIYAQGVAIRTLFGHEGPIEQIKYNNKGDFIATASKDKTVRIWNTKQLNQQPFKISDHADWVWCIAFSPNDEQIMIGLHSSRQVVRLNTGGEKELETEESIRAYPTKITAMSNILCEGYITRNLTQEEWSVYVGQDLAYETTCPNYPAKD